MLLRSFGWLSPHYTPWYPWKPGYFKLILVVASLLKKKLSLSWNPKAYCRDSISPPLNPILSQLNSAHILITYFMIHLFAIFSLESLKIVLRINISKNILHSDGISSCEVGIYKRQANFRYKTEAYDMFWRVFKSTFHNARNFKMLTWITRPLSSAPNRVGVSHTSPEDKDRYSFRNVVFFFKEYQTMDKVRNPSNPECYTQESEHFGNIKGWLILIDLSNL
jgi:hypothetical protein